MRARTAALVSVHGTVIDMWRSKPEADHERLRLAADSTEPHGAPHQWVVMAPNGEMA